VYRLLDCLAALLALRGAWAPYRHYSQALRPWAADHVAARGSANYHYEIGSDHSEWLEKQAIKKKHAYRKKNVEDKKKESGRERRNTHININSINCGSKLV